MMAEKSQKRSSPEKLEGKKRTGQRKRYSKPEILLDLELETRAGTPLSPFPNPLDLEDLP